MPTNRPRLPALDARPGPSERISEARARAMVDGALERAFERSTRPRVRPAVKVALALAATLVVGAAGAATARTWFHAAPPAPTLEAPTAVPSAATRTTPAAAAAQPPGPADDISQAPEPVAAPSAQLTPQARPAVAPPDDLLRQANELRAARRWRDAARAYERVLGAHPGSQEAYAAAVAAADLHLEQMGDPAGALRLYRTALQRNPQGPLSDPALWGIARCRRGLGDTESERSALGDYLARYPGGLFASNARQRLDALRNAAP